MSQSGCYTTISRRSSGWMTYRSESESADTTWHHPPRVNETIDADAELADLRSGHSLMPIAARRAEPAGDS